MKIAAVFRHQLFKRSEPFIVQQALSLMRYQPMFVGRERVGPGTDAAEVLALADDPARRSLARRIWLAATRDSAPYASLLRERRPALIHAHFGVDGLYALSLAKRLRIPLVTTFHGFDATLSTGGLIAARSPAWLNYALFRRQLALEGQLFLCVSNFILNKVRSLGFPEDKTHLHYIGIDVQNILPRDEAEEQPIILHVARLVEKKGTMDLVEAFARCARRHSDFRLMIIGDGPMRGKVQELVGDLGLVERVVFLGAQPHETVMHWMRRAAVLALPSVRARNGDAEGLGMVLLEAAASGVPMVGTWHGGIPEAIVDGETGYLVKERDVPALGERLEWLIGNSGIRREMGRRARLLVEKRFDIRVQTAELESFYDLLTS